MKPLQIFKIRLIIGAIMFLISNFVFSNYSPNNRYFLLTLYINKSVIF